MPDRELLTLGGGVVVVGLVRGAQRVPDGVTVVDAPVLAVGGVEDDTGGTLVPLVAGAGMVPVGVGVNVEQAEGLVVPVGVVEAGVVSTGVVEAGARGAVVVRTGTILVVGAVDRGPVTRIDGVERDDDEMATVAAGVVLARSVFAAAAGADDVAGVETAGVVRPAANAPASRRDGADAEDECTG